MSGCKSPIMHRRPMFRPRPESIIDNCICVKGKKDCLIPFCFCEKEKGFQCEFCEENLNTDCNSLECKCYCHSASSKCTCEHYCSPECLCDCHGNIKKSPSFIENENIKIVKNYFRDEEKLTKSIDLSNSLEESPLLHNNDYTLSIDYINDYFEEVSKKIEKSCQSSSSCLKDKYEKENQDENEVKLCKCNIECPVGCLCSFLCKAKSNCVNSCFVSCECKCHIEMNLMCACSDLCNDKCICSCHKLILECKKGCYCGCHMKCANDEI